MLEPDENTRPDFLALESELFCMEYGVNLSDIWPIPRACDGYISRKR